MMNNKLISLKVLAIVLIIVLFVAALYLYFFGKREYKNTKYGYSMQYPLTWRTKLYPQGEGEKASDPDPGDAIADSTAYRFVDRFNQSYGSLSITPIEGDYSSLDREGKMEIHNNIVMYVTDTSNKLQYEKRYLFLTPKGKSFFIMSLVSSDLNKMKIMESILFTFKFDSSNRAACNSKDSNGWCVSSIISYQGGPDEYKFRLHYPESWQAAQEELGIGYKVILKKGQTHIEIWNTATEFSECLYSGPSDNESGAISYPEFTEINKGNDVIWRLSKIEGLPGLTASFPTYYVCQKGKTGMYGTGTFLGWISVYDENRKPDADTLKEIEQILKKVELIK